MVCNVIVAAFMSPKYLPAIGQAGMVDLCCVWTKHGHYMTLCMIVCTHMALHQI